MNNANVCDLKERIHRLKGEHVHSFGQPASDNPEYFHCDDCGKVDRGDYLPDYLNDSDETLKALIELVGAGYKFEFAHFNSPENKFRLARSSHRVVNTDERQAIWLAWCEMKGGEKNGRINK